MGKEGKKDAVIYLNNAATSWPKPSGVPEAVKRAVTGLPPGQYRSIGDAALEYAGDEALDHAGSEALGYAGVEASGHARSTDQSMRAAEDGTDAFDECRKLLALLIGTSDSDRIFFTSGATESMNLVLQGLGIPAEQIITTATEHNSVLRPLYNLPSIKGKPVILSCDRNGVVDPELFERTVAAEAVHGRIKALILNHCSNVTGAVQDAAVFGEIAKRYGLLFLLDASQSAGCTELHSDAWKADGVIFTGHKSLMGISGTGGFFLRKDVPFQIVRFGGTGRESEKLLFEPGEAAMEVGTQNVPGIFALREGVRWIMEQGKTGAMSPQMRLKRGVEKIQRHERRLRCLAVEELLQIGGITLYGAGSEPFGPVLSFTSNRISPSDLGYILSSAYHIITRTGLHCSPLIHDRIGSGRKGTVRISFSAFNTEEDIRVLAAALREIHLSL